MANDFDELAIHLDKIREAKARYSALESDFKDVEAYCLAKRDDTLTMFLEMENFIEKNVDVFYNPKDTWVARGTVSVFGQKNAHNRVVVYFYKDDVLRVWIDKGIVFALNKGKVVYISKMEDNGIENKESHNHKFRFFSEKTADGTMPTEGYARYGLCSPTFENYFPKRVKPTTYQEWKKFKSFVDEDYNAACECKKLLIQGVVQICEDERNYHNGIVELKASVNKGSDDGEVQAQ